MANPSSQPYASITTSEGKQVRVELEVADSPQERAVGLSRRESLSEQAGMLFVFPAEQQAAFWMKDTFIPLSIAFISMDGVVLDIQDMQPLSEELHIPAYPYRYALEVNQGFFREHGVEAGAEVQFHLGGNS